MKVLICEDEEMLLRALEFRLQKDGNQIITAADGKVAIEKIESENPDIIITDIMLPLETGLEIISFVRNKLKRDTPIIVLSAIGTENFILEAFRLGADDYITKPFSPNELSIRVQKLSLKKNA